MIQRPSFREAQVRTAGNDAPETRLHPQNDFLNFVKVIKVHHLIPLRTRIPSTCLNGSTSACQYGVSSRKLSDVLFDVIGIGNEKPEIIRRRLTYDNITCKPPITEQFQLSRLPKPYHREAIRTLYLLELCLTSKRRLVGFQ